MGDNRSSTSRSTPSGHSVNTDASFDHQYLTRSMVRRNKADIDYSTKEYNNSRKQVRGNTSRQKKSDDTSPSDRRKAPDLISRNLIDTDQGPSRNLRILEARSCGGYLAFDADNQDRDFPPCRGNRVAAGSKIWRVCFSAFVICFIGAIIWSTNSYLQSMKQEMCKLKEQMGNMKSGGNCDSSGKKSDHKTCDKKDNKLQMAIRQALEEYGADKTGKTDFALETSGGSIFKVVDTLPYETKSRTTLFGFPICREKNGPRSLIQASSLPGECWAFKGTKGSVIIQLLGPVYIDGVSLEHIPRSISPTGDIDSAPKEFSIWGLTEPVAGRGQQLGKFVYRSKGESVQHFPITCPEQSYMYVQFNVFSNHGNPEFTCVYRLRVHGTLDIES